MITRERRLLKIGMTLALALLVMAPLASFGAVVVGIGVAAPGPGYVWVPGYYNYNAWVPGAWALPPYAGAAWYGPHWGWYGGQRVFVRGYWGGGPGFHGGYGYRGGPAFHGAVGFHGGFHGGGFHGGGFHGGGVAHHR